MGKKLDALLGRRFKTSKFRATANMAVSRLAVLKNQRQARCSIARSDVVEFLNNSNRDRALLRVEQVIKEQNMLDVFNLVEGYCHLLMERVKLIEQERNCPEELKEAISSLIYVATRCGEFPELQEIRAIFTSRFGKEFAARAIELRNNCGVNPKIIQKLSTRMPSLENKMKVLKDIASENNIDLPIEVEETVSCTVSDSSLLAPSGVSNPGENKMIRIEYLEKDEQLSDPVKVGRKYRDAADAAQAAFESATYAAVAARAAMQLSRSDPPSPDFRPPKLTALIEPMKGKLQPNEEDPFEKIHPVQNYDSKTKNRDLRIENVKEGGMSCDEVGSIRLRDVVFHEIDGGDERSGITDNDDSDVDQKNDGMEGISRGDKHFPLKYEVGYKTESSSGNFDDEKITQTRECLKINRRPVSVRTRWTHAR